MSKRPEHPMSPTCGVEKRHRTRVEDLEEGKMKVTLPETWKRLENRIPGDCKPAKDPAWVPHRDPTTYALPPVPTIKAYKNPDFLGSSHARSLRMMLEYEETMQRIAACGIRATVQFFGSARAKDREDYDKTHDEMMATLRATKAGSTERTKAAAALKALESTEWMIEYLDKTRELARRLTEWSLSSQLSSSASVTGVSRGKSKEKAKAPPAGRGKSPKVTNAAPGQGFRYLPHATEMECNLSKGELVVCTGGAGGFMEAANRGAADVPGGRSIGMGISLPFESGLNPYVTPELAFEYHYFFTRKLCMAFHMQALVVAPGGFGTCDEMFEMMTLKQTGKMQSNLPIVLLGKAYWEKVINWSAFAESGTIKKHDVDTLLFTDDVDEAFEYITQQLGMMRDSPIRA